MSVLTHTHCYSSIASYFFKLITNSWHTAYEVIDERGECYETIDVFPTALPDNITNAPIVRWVDDEVIIDVKTTLDSPPNVEEDLVNPVTKLLLSSGIPSKGKFYMLPCSLGSFTNMSEYVKEERYERGYLFENTKVNLIKREAFTKKKIEELAREAGSDHAFHVVDPIVVESRRILLKELIEHIDIYLKSFDSIWTSETESYDSYLARKTFKYIISERWDKLEELMRDSCYYMENLREVKNAYFNSKSYSSLIKFIRECKQSLEQLKFPCLANVLYNFRTYKSIFNFEKWDGQ